MAPLGSVFGKNMIAKALISLTLLPLVVSGLALAGPDAVGPAVRLPADPNWKATVVAPRARIGQPFVIDGVYVQIDRIRTVPTFADGTPPDDGTRVVETDFWLNNALTEKTELYDRFYAYAILSDGTDTNGDGLSFFPIDSSKELSSIGFKPGQVEHLRFDFEVPANTKITRLVVFGPIDGATVSLPVAL